LLSSRRDYIKAAFLNFKEYIVGAALNLFNQKNVNKQDMKEKVKHLVALSVANNGDGGYSGTWAEKKGDSIDFIDIKPFTNLDEAEQYLDCNCDKWGAILVVPYEINFENKLVTGYLAGALCSE
jgi:hypothetical protein